MFLTMKKEWVATVNRSKARIFERNGKNSTFILISDIDYLPGRQKNMEQKSDGPGRNQNSAGNMGHAFTPQNTARDHALDTFSHEIAAMINREAYNNTFDKLYLFAEDKVLGKLRELFDKHTNEKLVMSQSKDLGSMAANAVKDYIENSRSI